MRGLNSVFLVGRVGPLPEIRRSRRGRPWCPLQVATDREAWALDGTRVDRTDWHEVQLVGRAAEVAEQSVRRGTIVAVEGTVTYEPWEDEHGQRHVTTTIVASRLVILSRPARHAGCPSDAARGLRRGVRDTAAGGDPWIGDDREVNALENP